MFEKRNNRKSEKHIFYFLIYQRFIIRILYILYILYILHISYLYIYTRIRVGVALPRQSLYPARGELPETYYKCIAPIELHGFRSYHYANLHSASHDMINFAPKV